jgi:eukaryotic-like serine/threonine-protein kinase
MAQSGLEWWQVISPYLDEGLSVPPNERTVWLASLRQRNPEVADYVQALLEEHELLAAEHFLEQSPHLPAPHPLAGQTVGAYTLLEPIGEGGMASVWLAERSDGQFERRVAVKFLSAAVMGRAGAERFRREGRILGGLSHPHIAELMDAGVSQAGLPYLVLEYVQGEHMDAFCDTRQLPVVARIRLFLDVLAAVAHAHSHLIVHRDIKPSNVLVRNDGEVKLLDFGIAKLLEADADAVSRLTLEVGAALTPQCAAPEQLTGKPITTATDVYALGVLLYMLLTGRHPAGSSSSSADLVRAIVENEPPRLPRAVSGDAAALLTVAAHRSTTPEKLRHLMRGDLETIVGKALKKDPLERYASVTALADDLRRYLAHEPISARSDSLRYRATKFVLRNRTAVALGSLALTAVIAGSVGTLLQARTARAQRDFALRELSRAEAINDLNTFVLSDAAPSGKSFTVNDLLARAQHIVDRQQGLDESSRVELLISIGQQYAAQDEQAHALQVLGRAYELSRQLPDLALRASASCTDAVPVAIGGDPARAETLVQEGLSQLPDEPQYALDRMSCYLRGSAVARAAGKSVEGIQRVLAAQAMLKKSLYRSALLESVITRELAEANREAGNYWNAISTFEQASAQLTRLGRDDTETAGTLFNNWALTLSQVGRPRDAEVLFRRALDISRDQNGERAVSPLLLMNYARVLHALHRLPEAADYAQRAYDQAVRAGHDVAVNQALLVRVRIYRDQHDYAQAERMLAEVSPRLRRALPHGHFALSALTIEESLNAEARGELPHAVRLMSEALSVMENRVKAGSPASEFLPSLLSLRARMEMQLPSLAQAEADASRAVTIMRQDTPPGKHTARLGNNYLVLARVLQAEGRREEARQAAASATEQLQDALGPDHPDTLAARQLAAHP